MKPTNGTKNQEIAAKLAARIQVVPLGSKVGLPTEPGEEVVAAIATALDEAEARGAEKERDEIARELEDTRFMKPGREAEQWKAIALLIRARGTK